MDVNCTISVGILDAHEIRHEWYKVRVYQSHAQKYS
jgi:hypothetical protein